MENKLRTYSLEYQRFPGERIAVEHRANFWYTAEQPASFCNTTGAAILKVKVHGEVVYSCLSVSERVLSLRPDHN